GADGGIGPGSSRWQQSLHRTARETGLNRKAGGLLDHPRGLAGISRPAPGGSGFPFPLPQPSSEGRGGFHVKILLIEDDRQAAAYLEKAFAEAGHVAHVAAD